MTVWVGQAGPLCSWAPLPGHSAQALQAVPCLPGPPSLSQPLVDRPPSALASPLSRVTLPASQARRTPA